MTRGENTIKRISMLACLCVAVGLSAPAAAAGTPIANDLTQCDGSRPAILASVSGIKGGSGMIRVQSYRATKRDWLEKGRWLKRIEVPVTGERMVFCVPVDQPGHYALAVRHDRNRNGKTDIAKDGGGMSNNPAISIFNLGKPSHEKVGLDVDGLKRIAISMKYMT
jgi:uncharacterized protein (DUF2141 family)